MLIIVRRSPVIIPDCKQCADIFGRASCTFAMSDYLQVQLPSSSIDKFIIVENCECVVSENGNVSKIS